MEIGSTISSEKNEIDSIGTAEDEPEMSVSDTSIDEEEDEDEDEDEDDDEDEDEDESEDEQNIGIASALPHRVTRANRYSTAFEDAQEEFWQHDTWQEEKNDEEYLCSEGEEQYKDIIDSDFDEIESSDEEDTGVGQIREIREKKIKKKSVYQDPALLAKKSATKKTTKLLLAKKKKNSDHSKVDKASRPQYSEIPHSQDKIKTRQTTQQKSEQVALMRIRNELIKEKRVKSPKRVKSNYISSYHEPSQQEHLDEAKRVEELNKQSLIALQEWEEERKRYVEYKKQSYQGHYSVWISWASDRLIMSDETAKKAEVDESFIASDVKNNPPAKYYKCDDNKDAPELLIFTDGRIPEVYQQGPSTKCITAPPHCFVTGEKAKYLDPLTNCFYMDAESFKKIRQWYSEAQDRQVISKLHEIEVLLKDKANEIDKLI